MVNTFVHSTHDNSRRAAPLLAALATSIVVLAACGAGAPASRAPAVSGASVFVRECSACHTLGAETGGRGPVGGSLRGYGLSAAQIARLARVMPVAHPLSPAELRAVSAYVAEVEKTAGARALSTRSTARRPHTARSPARP